MSELDSNAGTPRAETPAPPNSSQPGCVRALGLGCASSVVGSILGAIASLVFLGTQRDEHPLVPLAFDSAAWKSPDRFDGGSVLRPLRQRMAADLVEHALAPGATRGQVRELLGAPSRWPMFDASPWFGREDEAWYLGPPVGVLSDEPQWLVLDFDAQDALVSARILEEGAAERATP